MASYEKRNSGLWAVRFITIDDGQVKHKRLSGFERKKDAEAAYIKYTQEHKKTEADPNKMTFGDLYASFWSIKESELKHSSLRSNDEVIKKYILPHFENLLIENITVEKILEWKRDIYAKGFSFEYLKRIYSNLNAIFRFGNNVYNIPNVASRAKNFKNTSASKVMLFWTENEFLRFISCADNLIYKAFFSFLYLTGARRGEALALIWNDIDFANGTVYISKQCDFHETGTTYVIYDTPKNESSVRTIYMPKNLCVLLIKLKSVTSGDFVFNNSRPLPPENIRRYLKIYCEKSGVKKIRLHDFRHSHASLLINKGNDILAVAQRLGHKNIEQTLNTYAHFFPDKQKELLKSLEIDLDNQ
ncbi:MAG: site-specific integrase [Clostridiales bacterium]|jgi:integrase|nr:site-specific integrase [Clostridiales bacterium]